MTYPFMPDPLPPGHGEPLLLGDPDRSYQVIVVLQDGNPTVEKTFAKLEEARGYRLEVIQELKDANHSFFFVGVMDEDDPERGWLQDEED